MKLHAVFEIEPTQEKWFRDRLPRLAEEISHGGLEITISERPMPLVAESVIEAVIESELLPETAVTKPVEVVETAAVETVVEVADHPLTRGRARKRAVTV